MEKTFLKTSINDWALKLSFKFYFSRIISESIVYQLFKTDPKQYLF